MVECVIFDFDGTLADTEKHSLNIYNNLAEKYGYNKFTKEEVEELKKLSPAQFIAATNIPYTDIFRVLKEGQKLLKKHMDEINAYSEDIKVILSDVKSISRKTGIVSSNLIINIKSFLNKYDISDLDFIVSSPLFSKENKIKRIIRRYRIKPEQILYIGDEVRDITSSRKAGVNIASASWGYNSKNLLMQNNPDFIMDDLSEVVSIIKRLNE